MSSFKTLIVMLLASLLLCTPALAKNRITGKGWYNYEPEKPKLDSSTDASSEQASKVSSPEATRVKTAADYSNQQLWSLHPKEFEMIMTATRQQALMSLELEDVRQWRRMHRIMTAKSQAVAAVWMMDAETNPIQDRTDPVTNPGIYAQKKEREAEIDRILGEASEDFALLYFHSEECTQYCPAQESILMKFARDFPNWEIAKISVLNDPLAAARFNVEMVPALFLIQNGRSEPHAVSLGVISLDLLKERIYRKILLSKGLVNPTQYFLRTFELGGPNDPNETASPKN